MITYNDFVKQYGYRAVLDDRKVIGRKQLSVMKNCDGSVIPEQLVAHFGMDGVAALTFDAIFNVIRDVKDCWWAAPGEVRNSTQVMLMGGQMHGMIDSKDPEKSAKRLGYLYHLGEKDARFRIYDRAIKAKVLDILKFAEEADINSISQRARYLHDYVLTTK